jgi:hypothetical protein
MFTNPLLRVTMLSKKLYIKVPKPELFRWGMVKLRNFLNGTTVAGQIDRKLIRKPDSARETSNSAIWEFPQKNKIKPQITRVAGNSDDELHCVFD